MNPVHESAHRPRPAARSRPDRAGIGIPDGDERYRLPEISAVAEGCACALVNMTSLDDWLRETGLPVDRELIPLMSLQSAFFTPWLPAAQALRVSRLTVWLMAVDNVLDDPGADPGRLDDRVGAWRRAIEGAAPAADDPLECSLAEIAADLQRTARPQLMALWRECMQETLTGMWFERESAAKAGRGEPIRLERYLRYGAWSIGVEQQAATLWALMDEPDLPRRLPVLRRAARHAATAIRLANDLRGHERERLGGEVDALALGLDAEHARRSVAENIEDCRLELASLVAIGYRPAIALERVMLWHARMYGCFDPVRPRRPAGPPGLADGYAPTEERKSAQMGIEQEILQVVASGGGYDSGDLERVFDKLDTVDAGFLIGSWKGGVFERRSENYKLLEQMRWYGKRFVSGDHVDPLLCSSEDGRVFSFQDMGLATIRDVTYRGRSSAAMVYDQLPIIDHFRKVSDDVVLGLMDKKGETEPFFFHLTRVPDPTAASGTAATAAVLRAGDGRYVLEQVELAEPGPGELRVKIAGAGLCRTDLLARSAPMAAALPIVLGHEGSGVVEAVGPGVCGVSVGDHVVLSFDSCAGCANCRGGHPSCCETFVPRNLTGRRADGSAGGRGPDGGDVAVRWFGQSSLATHAIATAANTVVVDRALPLEKLGPLGCGIQTGAGSVLHALRVTAGSSLAVLGAGTVGLAAVMAARVAGAARILAVDLSDDRLALAREFGATDTVRGDAPDLAGQIRSRCPGGFQFALDTTGEPAVIAAGIAALRATGTVGLVGVQNGDLVLDGLALGVGKTLAGIVEGDVVPQVFIPQLIELWRQGRFPFDRLLKTYPLSEVNDAERDMLAGKVVKPVLVP